eukprot:352708_1
MKKALDNATSTYKITFEDKEIQEEINVINGDNNIVKHQLIEQLNQSLNEIERINNKIYKYEEMIDYSADIIAEFKEREHKLCAQITRRNNGLLLCKEELENKDKEIFNMQLKIKELENKSNDAIKKNNELQINNKMLNDKLIELNNKTNKNENLIKKQNLTSLIIEPRKEINDSKNINKYKSKKKKCKMEEEQKNKNFEIVSLLNDSSKNSFDNFN